MSQSFSGLFMSNVSYIASLIKASTSILGTAEKHANFKRYSKSFYVQLITHTGISRNNIPYQLNTKSNESIQQLVRCTPQSKLTVRKLITVPSLNNAWEATQHQMGCKSKLLSATNKLTLQKFNHLVKWEPRSSLPVGTFLPIHQLQFLYLTNSVEWASDFLLYM